MNEYVKKYVKRHRKTTFCYFGLSVLCILLVLGCFDFLIIYNLNPVYCLFPMLGVLCCLRAYIKRALKRNIESINNILNNKLDVDTLLECYTQLMERKKCNDFPVIYINYLKILLQLGKFDEFVEVYKSNRKTSKWVHLESIQEIILSLKNDRKEYRKLIFKHKSSKYSKAVGSLSKRKEELRQKDQYYEVMQLYEMKEYRKVIDRIDRLYLNNPYEMLFYQSYKERSLYHLNENYSLPDEECYPFTFVMQWKYLIETGEEYVNEFSDDILEFIEQDGTAIHKKIKLCNLFAFIIFFIFGIYLFVSTSDEETREKNHYVAELSVWDYEATALYGLCSNDDLAGAILYGNKTDADEDVLPGYIFTRINYYTDAGVPMMKLDILPLLYLGGTYAFSLEGETSTYVTVLTENMADITYDGKEIKELKCEKLPPAPLFLEPYAYSFIVEGKYETGLIAVDGKTLTSFESLQDSSNQESEGVKLTATNATTDGLVLSCSYTGNILNVQTGTRYWLEEKTSEGWKKIEIEDDEDRWKSYTYYLEKDLETVIEINWGNVYWKVPSGEYRIGKEFTWFDEETSVEVTQPIYAEFEIKD